MYRRSIVPSVLNKSGGCFSGEKLDIHTHHFTNLKYYSIVIMFNKKQKIQGGLKW